ncbi:MAG: beta-N-acetylhexosaminidase [Myxococcota bacterium]|nr:beta-N-acetylhexosaminidase [Myxococcota bacterium]
MSGSGPADAPGQLLFAGFEGSEVPDDLAEGIASGRIGGVVLFARNLPDEPTSRALVRSLHRCAPAEAPLIVSIDEEGGRVQRLPAPFSRWPAARELGDAHPPEKSGEVGRGLGRELGELGIDLDFAPCVDVAGEGVTSAIGDRSFGSSPERVAAHAVAVVRGLQQEGVGACAKHFPGHGRARVDSHESLPCLDVGLDVLRASDFLPFRACIEADVSSVMVGHLALAELDAREPATFSVPILRCLREELGFQGVVFSDDLDMGALRGTPASEIVARGLRAGIDGFLACRDPELRVGLQDALEASPRSALRPALERMRRLKRRFAGGRRRPPGA